MRISDWSSDVCSSDLEDEDAPKRKRASVGKAKKATTVKKKQRATENGDTSIRNKANREQRVQLKLKTMTKLARIDEARRACKWWEIGRGSCRERVCQYV